MLRYQAATYAALASTSMKPLELNAPLIRLFKLSRAS